MNRPRVAALAVLYGLALASDHQVIYRLAGEPLVFSVDHGHFFHGGPNWTVQGLANGPPAQIDPLVIRECGLTRTEVEPCLDKLRSLVATKLAGSWLFRPMFGRFPWTIALRLLGIFGRAGKRS